MKDKTLPLRRDPNNCDFPASEELLNYLESNEPIFALTAPGTEMVVLSRGKLVEEFPEAKSIRIRLQPFGRAWCDQREKEGLEKISGLSLAPYNLAKEAHVPLARFLHKEFGEKLYVLIELSTETKRWKDLKNFVDEKLMPNSAGMFVDKLADGLNAFAESPGVMEMLIEILEALDVETRLDLTIGAYERIKYNGPERKLIKEREKSEDPVKPKQDDNEKEKYPPEVWDVIASERKRIEAGLGHQEADLSRKYLGVLERLPWKVLATENSDPALVSRKLNLGHYGMEQAKDKILDHIAVRTLNRDSRGEIICLEGPPGVGKTSLARSIADSLGLPFGHINLGGVHDMTELRGHRRTYIGAIPGSLIRVLIKAGVKNPVILLDEVDKIGIHNGSREVENALLEILDPTENANFRDHFLDVPFDLSRVTFIAAINEPNLSPSLLDRMDRVVLHGYGEAEKLIIAREYLIPQIRHSCGLTNHSIPHLTNELLLEIVRSYTHEAGVRKFREKLLTVHKKIARKIVSGILLGEELSLAELKEHLGDPQPNLYTADFGNFGPGVGVFLFVQNGLGDVGTVEVTLRKKRSQSDDEITGNLGKDIHESVKLAIGRIREKFPHLFEAGSSYHLHVSDGGTPKRGPSAGVIIYTALVSAFSKIPIKPGFAVTGENMLLRDAVDPVGGIVQKLLGAERRGLIEVAIPSVTAGQLGVMPKDHLEKMEIIRVGSLGDNPEAILRKLVEVSRLPKRKFTVYLIDTPEQALAIAFPEHFFSQIQK